MIPKLPAGFTHPLLIGEGAFSSVYRVRQTSLDRWVAIKIISETNPIRRKELLYEAKTQANIHLDCIPQVYDTFEWNKKICIVMQWIKGASLKAILDVNPHINHRYRIANSLVSVVANLHKIGFAHRDLKPENILISPDNGVYLVDFGFTKNVSDTTKSINGIVKGTPAYMAPELWNSGKNVNYLRADLFALGKILKELFPSENTLQEKIYLLLNFLPDNRPESACEFETIWNSVSEITSEMPNWQQIAGNLSHKLNSRKLLISSKDLLYAHRYEESYWLLVECIEEDPDYDEAIKFMRDFPHSAKSKKNKNFLLVSILSLLIIVSTFAYMIGRHSKNDYLPYKSQNLTKLSVPSQQLLNINNNKQFSHTMKLFEDTLNSISLSGRILLQQYPADGSLLIDSIFISDKTKYKTGIECQNGMHQLFWKNSSGKVIWREKLSLLPFQTKQISIKKDL